MKKWNAWGEAGIRYPLTRKIRTFLEKNLGKGNPLPVCSVKDAVSKVPQSRLEDDLHPLIETDPEIRLRHSCGQSIPDLLSVKSGNLAAYTDGVAFPKCSEDVKSLLSWCRKNQVEVIPYGGGTSVLGHVTPSPGAKPTLTISLAQMNQLIDLDREALLARFGAGVTGEALEAQLRPSGFLLGHYPQSFEFSSLGGWVATRSCGQQSIRYGRIEKLFAGGTLETFAGTVEIPVFPASAAGMDMREVILGSEGRVGILTEAVVRISPIPIKEEFYAFFFPDWQLGMSAVRILMQEGLPLSMLRLSNANETKAQLMIGGHPLFVYGMEKWLKIKGVSSGKCMMLIGFSGRKEISEAVKQCAFNLIEQQKGVGLGTLLGKAWKKNRFKVPYLRESLWNAGYIVDTLETACCWTKVNAMARDIEVSLESALCHYGERVFAFTHLSHPYPQGSSVYTTYIFRAAASYEETLARWQKLKTAASEAIVALGGTISHQHGVGKDHRAYLEKEKGTIGMETIRAICDFFDRDHLLSRGNLYER